MTDLAFSEFTERLWETGVPERIRALDDQAGNPFLRWLAGFGDVGGELAALVDRFSYVPPAAGGPATGPGSTSDLVDPVTAEPDWLPWLAQLANVRLDTSAALATQRDAVGHPQIGWEAGSVPAIVAAAQAYLMGEQIVIVTPFTSDQWHYTVSVYAAQLIGTTYGQIGARYPTYALLDAAFATYGEWTSSQADLLAALEAQVPAGMTMAFVVLTGAPYAVLDPAFTPYSALDGAFATYADMSSWTP